MNPLVSVIVPVYNTSKYLRQCLNSIQSQTLKNIEIIFVDDGSTDDSLVLLEEMKLQDARIIIMQQKNKGGGAARNLGMTVAKGAYLLFLDSDDFFEETFIEKMYTAAVETSADIVVCQYREYNEATSEISGKLGVNPRFLSHNKIRIYNNKSIPEIDWLCLFPWNKLCSHKFIQENNLYFQETYKHNDNYFAITATLSAKKIAIIPDALVYYRVGMTTNTQATIYKHPYDLFEVISAVHQYLDTTNQFQKYEISFYEFVINSFRGQLNKLKKYDCLEETYTQVFHIINSYDMSSYSQKNCHNKLTYKNYLKLIKYPYSKYINEDKRDKLLFILGHPALEINIWIYLLRNTWWMLTTHGFKELFYRISHFTQGKRAQ